MNPGEKSFQYALKKLMDFSLAAVLLIVLCPLIVLIALIIRVKLGSPVIFRQKRPGYKENIFTVYKFRTMSEARDKDGNLLPDGQRLTGTGRFIRSMSLDELPQLWNILKGDMSLIGPRALLIEYLDRYSEEQRRRHEARPGITGWAQVNGRNILSWEEKFSFDVWYVDNWSLWLDIKIIFMTIWKVLKREGISQEGQATMEEFKGRTHQGKNQ